MAEDSQSDGLRGRLFYSDGTITSEPLSIRGELSGMFRADSSGAEETLSDSKGRFHLPLGQNERSRPKLFVQGHQIDPKRIHYVGGDYATVVLPPMLGKRGGDAGGLITGQVVDDLGNPREGAKVSAQVVSGSLLSFLNTSFAETKTNKHGYFALEFEGGTEIKNLSVDGNDPEKVTRKRKDGDDVEIDSPTYKAGSFGLTLVRKKKLLGIF